MLVCLVTAPTITEFAAREEITSRSVHEVGSDPQLGVLSLAGVLEQTVDQPEIVEINRTFLRYHTSCHNPRKQLDFTQVAAQDIAAKEAPLYGFSTICSSYSLTIRIAQAVKQLRPESKILLGGPQASVVDIATLTAFPFVDFILRGEAEESLPHLVRELEGEYHLDRVPGLTHRQSGQVHRNPNAPVIQDLDALPSPAYHLTGDLRGSRTAALELGRGCPFACTFCSTNDFFRRKFRLRSPGRVLRDMREIAATYSIRDFDLVHDMFTVDRQRVMAFCNAMIASGEAFTWLCSARTDCIDEELLELMARAGCRGIFFGVETGSARMQKIIDKHLDPKRSEEIIDAAERLGIRTTVALITGFPEETWEDLQQTMRVFMHSARCIQSHPQLNLLAPLAETPLHSSHKNELVFDELCSSMSHQGQDLNNADLELIRKYPDIFPNFYAIPTRHLDRRCLYELREFALMGVARFRWLLTAIHQATTGILDFFLEWRERRLQLRPTLAGPTLRRYYRVDSFQTDFLSFVKSHRAVDAFAVKALLEYELSLRRARLRARRTASGGQLLPSAADPRRSDRPVRKSCTPLLELKYDMQRIVDALKAGMDPRCQIAPHFYVTREVSPGINRLECVSDWMAQLLRLCNGRRRVDEIVERLSIHLPEVDRRLHGYVCMRLLAGAHAQGLIDIYRGSN